MQYESKQQQINCSAEVVFAALSKFSNFTPMLADKVDSWQATDDECSFMAKGFRVALQVEQRTANTMVKIVSGEGGAPFPFTLWLQLKEVAPDDTRLRIVAQVELNMMMKMVVGNKLQEALDSIAAQIAQGFNTK